MQNNIENKTITLIVLSISKKYAFCDAVSCTLKFNK